MHKVARDGIALKRWLRQAGDRCERMPADLYSPLGVDNGTWARWNSLDDDRSLPISYLPLVLANLDGQAWDDFAALVQRLAREAV